MLNQTKQTASDQSNQWCVGEEPTRWDISFGALVADQFKRWFGKHQQTTLRSIDLKNVKNNSHSQAA